MSGSSRRKGTRYRSLVIGAELYRKASHHPHSPLQLIGRSGSGAVIGSEVVMEQSPSQKSVAEERQKIQDTLGNDYTGIAMLVGALMIATAFVFMWLSVTFPFSITGYRRG